MESQRQAVQQYELLRSEESERLALVQSLELNLRNLLEQDQEIRDREETHFADNGRWSTLLVRGANAEEEPQARDKTRIGIVEERVDELHSRFDRLELLLERLTPRQDN